ncbi:terminase small subunit [Bacilliculturomica massiliensis]|uniref:terminase small subunit n=1 Tax=Bacilliculturomica massiliensis TaxID=1917867 RepID=UPI0010326CA4|nr:terminase small subunit [Bacilliculturomica massiliensis]
MFTGKKQKFAEEYLIDLNATQAAIRAGYSPKTAHSQGQRLLKDVDVANYIKQRQKQLQKKTEITQERVLAEYAKLAFFDPRNLFETDGSPKSITELDDETAAALAGLDVQEVFEGVGSNRVFAGYIKKYKLADKRGALDSLARHLGMFTDKVEIKGEVNNPYAALSTEDLKKLIGDG